MLVPALDLAARTVLAAYADVQPVAALARLGKRGGFSGASLWRVEGPSGAVCLRAWPAGQPSVERLQWIHHLMRQARAAGLAFVPRVLATASRATATEHAGRLWDVTTWMPGQADFHAQPARARLEAACAALALLHAAWARVDVSQGPCPAVQRRLACLEEWENLLRSGWRPAMATVEPDPVTPWAERAWQLVQTHRQRVSASLAGWVNQSGMLQPCLCDIWHDHVLFEGPQVTGIIDYGSAKVDHVAVDLARLLGSMVGDDAELRTIGLEAYARLHPLSLEDEALIKVLDETGTLLGAANWLTWLYRDARPFEDRTRVAERLAALVERLERKWT